MARRNSRFVNQKIVIGNKSIQEGDLTDSARDALGADSDFVKDVIFKLDSDFVNLGFGIDGSSIRDSSITQDKFADEVVAALLSGLDSSQTVSLIYPGGELYKITEYTPNNSTNSYSVSAGTNGAFVFMQGAAGGGSGGAVSSSGGTGLSGGGGGGAGGGFVKLSRSDLETVNIIQVGNAGAGGAGGTSVGSGSVSGSSGGVTKISTANASLLQANGGAGANGCSSTSNGNGGAGGTFSFDTTNVISLYTYNGNAGGAGTGQAQTNNWTGGSGGTGGRNPALELGDIGTGLALFRLTSDSDEIAKEVINTPNLVNSVVGGRGGRSWYNAGSAGSTAGQIIIYEFK